MAAARPSNNPATSDYSWCTESLLKILDIIFCASKLAHCSWWAVARPCQTGPKRLESNSRSCNVPERHITWHPRCQQLGSLDPFDSWFQGHQTCLKRFMFGCLGRIGWGLGGTLYGLAQFDDEYYRLSNARPKNKQLDVLSTGRIVPMSCDAGITC